MTNQEAYIADLNELKTAIETLTLLIKPGKTKKDSVDYEKAQEIGDKAITTIRCMENDYIPIEM